MPSVCTKTAPSTIFVRACTAFLVAGALSGALACASATPSTRDTLREVQIPAPSLHQAGRSVLVYLPPSYDETKSLARRYPVIIFLHGGPGSNTDWIRRARIGRVLDSLIASRAIPEVIALMPDANGMGTEGRSLYLNTYDGRQRMEDFMTSDLIDWADSHLRTRARSSQRALVGISDGASAAINLAFKHPDRFGACAGHSGNYEWNHLPPMPRVLGPEPYASRLLLANSPRRYVGSAAHRLRELVIYFDTGVLELDVLDNLDLHLQLTSLHIPHAFQVYPGYHGWSSWRPRFAVSLPFVTRNMR